MHSNIHMLTCAHSTLTPSTLALTLTQKQKHTLTPTHSTFHPRPAPSQPSPVFKALHYRCEDKA